MGSPGKTSHWEDEHEWRLILLLHSSKDNCYNTLFLIKPGIWKFV